MISSEQLAPHSIEAEEAILGAILVNPDCIYDLPFLSSDDFFIVRHSWIWEAMHEIVRRGDPIDYLLVVSELEQMGKLAEYGGAAAILDLVNKTPSSLNAVGYGRLVERLSLRRRLIDAASQVARFAHSDETDIEEVCKRSERAVLDVIARRKKAVRVTAAEADRRIDDNNSDKTLFTRIEELDRLTDHQIKHGRTLHIMAASGQLKTTLASELLADWALENRLCLFVSMETMVEDVKNQMNKYIAWSRRMTYQDARQALNKTRLEFLSDRQSVRDIEAHIMSMSYGGQELGIVVIDTIQKLTDAARQDQAAVAAASAALDGARLRTGWLFVVLCQQYLKTNSRDVDDLRPSRANVKDAKAIYQDSRLMLGGYYADDWRQQFGPSWDDSACGENEYLLKCLKNTFGSKSKMAGIRLAVIPDIPAVVSPTMLRKPVQQTLVAASQEVERCVNG